MHLYEKFGSTYREILDDKLKIYKKINIQSSQDKAQTIPSSFSLAVKKFSIYFKKEKPDIVILPCDRLEIFAVALACFFNDIPVIHFYGGDTSLGSKDEFFRNFISNIAKFHFVSHAKHKEKIIKKFNIEKKSIFHVGAISIDKIPLIKLFTKFEIENKLKIDLKLKTILFTYHPVTINSKTTVSEINNCLKVLKDFEKINIIFTKTNNDRGHDHIIKKINKFCKKDPSRYKHYNSLGNQMYFSIIKYSTFVAGNSSSLFYEVPYFNKYSLNIGLRQKGRLGGNSVINCKSDYKNLKKIFSKYLRNSKINKAINPYRIKNSTKRTIKLVLKILKSI